MVEYARFREPAGGADRTILALSKDFELGWDIDAVGIVGLERNR